MKDLVRYLAQHGAAVGDLAVPALNNSFPEVRLVPPVPQALACPLVVARLTSSRDFTLAVTTSAVSPVLDGPYLGALILSAPQNSKRELLANAMRLEAMGSVHPRLPRWSGAPPPNSGAAVQTGDLGRYRYSELQLAAGLHDLARGDAQLAAYFSPAAPSGSALLAASAAPAASATPSATPSAPAIVPSSHDPWAPGN